MASCKSFSNELGFPQPNCVAGAGSTTLGSISLGFDAPISRPRSNAEGAIEPGNHLEQHEDWQTRYRHLMPAGKIERLRFRKRQVEPNHRQVKRVLDDDASRQDVLDPLLPLR